MKFKASLPSNIALIKYMGKKETLTNTADNISISMTLPHLFTCVEIEAHEKDSDVWENLKGEGLYELELSQKAQKRFLAHFQFLKEEFEIKGFFKIFSANNFPSDCGLASSASSFASLTACTHKLSGKNVSLDKLACLSQKGSGSSCRSFFSPWSIWDEKGVRTLDLPLLNHEIKIIDTQKKEVSSSEAHLRVRTSPLYEKRQASISSRAQNLLRCLKEGGNWAEAFRICWDEFDEMHRLFETSAPSFSYRTEKTYHVLDQIQDKWSQLKDGPLVTMDAGNNIHLLWRKDFERDKFFLEF